MTALLALAVFVTVTAMAIRAARGASAAAKCDAPVRQLWTTVSLGGALIGAHFLYRLVAAPELGRHGGLFGAFYFLGVLGLIAMVCGYLAAYAHGVLKWTATRLRRDETSPEDRRGRSWVPVMTTLFLAAVGLGFIVREATLSLAESPRTPMPVVRQLVTLAIDARSTRLVASLASNPRLEPAQLDAIARLPWASLADPLEGLLDFLRPSFAPPLERVAGHGNVLPDTLRTLAVSDADSVRRKVAECERAPADVLARLAGDSNARVRSSVARNPTQTLDLNRKLSGDSESSVRRRARRTLSRTPRLLLAARSSVDPADRLLVARNEFVDAEVLRELALDPSVEVRRAVSENPAVAAGSKERFIDEGE